MTDLHAVAKQLRAKYEEQVVEPRGLYLLRPDVARQMIQEGVESGLSFACVEGFRILPSGAYQPAMEFSNGVVDPTDEAQYLEETFQLLRSGQDAGILFEVWFEED